MTTPSEPLRIAVPTLNLDPYMDPADVPAVVLQLGGRRVAVWHMDGEQHENYRLTVRRLVNQGCVVCPWPDGITPRIRSMSAQAGDEPEAA